jgi:hypothetical protein
MHGFFIDWAQGIVVCVNKSLQLRDEIVSRASPGQFHPCSFAWSGLIMEIPPVSTSS